MKIFRKLNISTFQKAYTEGVYADTPQNKKLGRVGMSYKVQKKEKDVYDLNNLIEKDKINFSNLKNITDAVIEGTKRIDCLNQAEEQGRKEGGRRNVEASIICKAVKSLFESSSESNGESRLDEEKRRIKEYAQKNDCWFDEEKLKTIIDQKLASGAESKVYISADKAHVIKVTKIDTFYEDLNEFLDNHISLYNYLFPESAYKVIGFSEEGDELRVIMEQPFIHGTPLINEVKPSQDDFRKRKQDRIDEITKDLTERIGELKEAGRGNLYANENYVIEDVHLGNVIRTPENYLIYIDVIPSLTTDEDYTWGKRSYGTNKIVDNV